jgi:putative DNA methylase
LAVVAAHPVHAELRAASPKSAARNPISLDAILVCKKRSQARATRMDQKAVIQRSTALAQKLVAAGMTLSPADYFVILASQSLVDLSLGDKDFESSCVAISRLHQLATQKGLPIPLSPTGRGLATPAP